jgi:hypothetical protein
VALVPWAIVSVPLFMAIAALLFTHTALVPVIVLVGLLSGVALSRFVPLALR